MSEYKEMILSPRRSAASSFLPAVSGGISSSAPGVTIFQTVKEGDYNSSVVREERADSRERFQRAAPTDGDASIRRRHQQGERGDREEEEERREGRRAERKWTLEGASARPAGTVQRSPSGPARVCSAFAL